MSKTFHRSAALFANAALALVLMFSQNIYVRLVASVAMPEEDRTVVVISHSISQIIDSDVIYLLKEGRMVEIGTHDELYARQGTYFENFNASARSLTLDNVAPTIDG